MIILKGIQDEIKTQKLEMISIKETIIEDINTNINKNFASIENKTNALEKKIEEQQDTIDMMDRQIRRKNLIFFGVEEKEKSYNDLEKSILHILNTTMKITCETNQIESVRRLGKKGENIRPVVVTVTTLGLKIQILRNKKLLDDAEMYIKEDFSKKILQKRKELQEELKLRREKGENVILKYDKIVELNKKGPNATQTLPSSSYSRNNKRKPSSPPETATATQNKNFNTAKKNKANTLDFYLSRSPSSSSESKEVTDFSSHE